MDYRDICDLSLLHGWGMATFGDNFSGGRDK